VSIIRFDVEIEDYKCEIPSANHEYCSTWLTLEHSSDEFEIGNSTCTEESENGHYCQAWYVSQLEYKRCWKEIDLGTPSQSITLCCNEDNKHNHCCENFCSPSFYDAFDPSAEFTECYCEVPSANGRFCQQWHCEEYDEISSTYETGREFETYTCLEYGGNGVPRNTTEEANHTYCQRWKGEVESVMQFELSRCNCTEESANGQYCQAWQCDEKGAYFWWPNTLWVLFAAVMAGLAPWYLIRWMRREWTRCNTKPSHLWLMSGRLYLIFFFWICPFALIGIWKAGFVIFLFVFIFDIVPVIAVFLICYDNLKRIQRAGGDLSVVEFNYFYEPATKIVVTSAYYVPREDTPETAAHSAVVTAVEEGTQDDAFEGDSGDQSAVSEGDIELSAMTVQRESHINAEARVHNANHVRQSTSSSVATGELVVPEGGFEIDCSGLISSSSDSSSTSSGSYDPQTLSMINKLLNGITTRYQHILQHNPFTNASEYYNDRHRDDHYSHRYSLHGSSDGSHDGW
jgi:hypothetical protein